MDFVRFVMNDLAGDAWLLAIFALSFVPLIVDVKRYGWRFEKVDMEDDAE